MPPDRPTKVTHVPLAPQHQTDPTDRTSDLLARDQHAVWHPFTQHSRWAEDAPLVIDRAEGMYLVDTEGRRYLDAVSSLWVTVHGHRVPEIDAAITAQLRQLDHSTFLGMTHEPGIRLAEELLRVAPTGPDRRLTRVFYAGDGSSAAEAAIKMAYQSALQRGERRPLYVHVAEGYHGDTLGAVSVGGIDLFHHTYGPILLETRMVSSPGVRREGQAPAERAAEVVAELRALMAAEGHAVCAVVVEPLVQGAGGMLTHDPQFLVGVREVCDTYGVAMVADEVATGIGATGRWWAVDHAGVVPDLLVLGKRVTGGYLPLSAVLATEEIFASFLGTPASARTFFHGHTYTANPLACAAALANLELMHTRNTVAHAADVGERLGARLAPLASHPGVREIRRIGTMTGVEVHPRTERTGFDVCRRAREHGVWLRPLGDVVVIMPPLAIQEPEIETIVAALASGLDEVFG